jgi:hypothetical protein
MDKLLEITLDSHVKLPWKEGGGHARPIRQIDVGSKSSDARWSWHFRRTLLVVFGGNSKSGAEPGSGDRVFPTN